MVPPELPRVGSHTPLCTTVRNCSWLRVLLCARYGVRLSWCPGAVAGLRHSRRIPVHNSLLVRGPLLCVSCTPPPSPRAPVPYTPCAHGFVLVVRVWGRYLSLPTAVCGSVAAFAVDQRVNNGSALVVTRATSATGAAVAQITMYNVRKRAQRVAAVFLNTLPIDAAIGASESGSPTSCVLCPMR